MNYVVNSKCFSEQLPFTQITALHTLGILSANLMIRSSGMVSQQSQLDLDWVLVEGRSSDATLHHSPSCTNSSEVLSCVWGHCLGGKQMLASKCKPERIACPCKMLWQPCTVVHNFDYSATSKRPSDITHSITCFTEGNYTLRNHLFTLSEPKKMVSWLYYLQLQKKIYFLFTSLMKPQT